MYQEFHLHLSATKKKINLKYFLRILFFYFKLNPKSLKWVHTCECLPNQLYFYHLQHLYVQRILV